MNGCEQETLLAWLENIQNGDSETLHPFVAAFLNDKEVRKAATCVSVLTRHTEGETMFLPSSLLPPLD